MWSLAALVIGFCIDLLVGDPHGFPHPVVLIGKCISVLERGLRYICPKTPSGGERWSSYPPPSRLCCCG